MFATAILDVTIGLVFVYLIVSLMCTVVQELVANVISLRSTTLEKGIKNLLEDPNIKDATEQVRDLSGKIYNHSLVKKLGKNGKKPSYIPSRTFALTLLDVLKDPNAAGGPLTEAENSVAKLPDGQLKEALTAVIDNAQGDIDKIRKNIENWFDDSMDRVSGWYKRTAQYWTLGIAFALAFSMNVDTVVIAKQLWKDPGLRAQVVATAKEFIEKKNEDELKSEEKTIKELRQERIKELRQELNDLPIGWEKPPKWPGEDSPWTDWGQLLLSVWGWLLTSIAVSLGAPFWFDMLSKLLNVRMAGRKPEKATS